MSILNKSLVFGLAGGIALTMIILDTWGGHLRRTEFFVEQPRLLRPLLAQPEFAGMPASSVRLPQPWFPQTSGSRQDKWQIRPLGGKFITLGDLAGKVVFLNFWLTSCGPCIAEMPGIEKLRDSLKAEKIAFLEVTEEDEPQVRSFLKKVPLDLPVYLAEEKPPKDFQVMGFPTTIILDRKGAAVYREVGGANWDNDGARAFLRGLAAQ